MLFSILGTVPKGWRCTWPWASPGHIPGHWEGLLGPVTSLGSYLDAGHSPWTSGQQGKVPGPWPGWNQLGKAGQGSWAWSGLDFTEILFLDPSNTDTYRTLWHTPWLELCWLPPESAVLVICCFAHFLTHFGKMSHFAVNEQYDSFSSFGNV